MEMLGLGPILYQLSINLYLRQGMNVHPFLTGGVPGVGGTKAVFVNFSETKIFALAKVLVRFFESHS